MLTRILNPSVYLEHNDSDNDSDIDIPPPPADLAISRTLHTHLQVAENVAKYPNATEVQWAQEEPKNMGAWMFVHDRILTATREINGAEVRQGSLNCVNCHHCHTTTLPFHLSESPHVTSKL